MSFTNIKNLENTGLQKICIDSSGTDEEFIYVCDSERNVLKFNKNSLLSDEKPTVIEILDATSAAIAWHGPIVCFGYRKVDFIIGTEQQMVGLAKNGKFDSDDIPNPLEFDMDVTTVDLNSENVVGGSSNYSVKCTSLNDPEAELKTRSLEAEILCVKLDPRNEFVAVSTVDGNVTIITLNSFTVAHTLTNVFPKFESADVSRPRVHMSWSKDGTCLFVPSKGSVKSYRRNSWVEPELFRLKDVEPVNFSVAVVSLCGKYLAASTMDNQVVVWSVEEMELISYQQFKRNAPGSTVITSIEFSPFSKNQIIIADSNKGICTLNITELSNSTRDEYETANEVVANESDDDGSIILNRTAKKDDLFNDEAMEDDGDTRMSSDISAIKRQYNYDDQDIGGLEEFGFNLGEPEATPILSRNLPTEPTEPHTYTESAKRMLVPERFVCNSSPSDPEASQRYLKYNRFGIVRSYDSEANKVSTIDIEFHDKNIHGDIHIDNFEINYELADISVKVVALASMESRKKEKELDKAEDEIEDLDSNEPAKEKKGTSLLHVIPIQAFDLQRWSITMPRGDGCLDVLCSNTQVVVLTRKRNIRVFTIGGIQRQIFTHFAPILTACCFDDRIAIASVAGSEFYEQKKTPQWRFEIVEYSLDQKSWYKKSRNLGTTGAVSRIDVPVETGEQLDWVAYSSQGKLAVMDSAYNVYILSAPGFWVPVFQGSSVLRGLSDGIFPIGLTTEEFRYIYCRGSRSPAMNGINAPTIVKFKVPFCTPESNRTEREHDIFLNELAIADSMLERNGNKTAVETGELTKKIIELYAWFVKADSDGQAAELASLVANGTAASSRTIQKLCTYASASKRVALSEKVAEIGRQMTNNDDDQVGVNDEIRPIKRIVKTVRKATKEPSPVQEDNASDDDEHTNLGDVSSRYNPSLDVSMLSQPVQPLERLAKNPFAKSTETASANDSVSSSQASLSIFDQLETIPVDHRKRAREAEPTMGSNPTSRKQAKLNFGTGSAQLEEKKKKVPQHLDKTKNVSEKENADTVEEPVKKSVSPYELWLIETKSSLQFEFDGEEADFPKYCIQSFRALSKDQKDEWKAKAHVAAAEQV